MRSLGRVSVECSSFENAMRSLAVRRAKTMRTHSPKFDTSSTRERMSSVRSLPYSLLERVRRLPQSVNVAVLDCEQLAKLFLIYVCHHRGYAERRPEIERRNVHGYAVLHTE